MTMQAPELEAVRKSVLVPLPVEKAFRLFTDGIGTWWPVGSHSIGGVEAVEASVVEPRAGGRVYERHHDGTEHEWATVDAWEPPSRLLLGWRVDPAAEPTEVEVKFRPEGEGTRVELEHRGFVEAERRSSYDTGWDVVLGAYVAGA